MSAHHLVRAVDRQSLEQARVDVMIRIGKARPRLAVNRFQPHPPHQQADSTTPSRRRWRAVCRLP